MVKKNSPLGLCGIYEWLIARVSAIIIFLYTIYVLVFFMFVDSLNYSTWCNFYSTYLNKSFTIIFLLSIVLHSWIGMWQVITDYIKTPVLQLVSQLIILIISITYFFYGFAIIWRI